MTDKIYESYTDEWKNLPWKKFQRTLFQLQNRIYKAAKKNDKTNVKQLQRLLIGSKCAQYISIREASKLKLKNKVKNNYLELKLSNKDRLTLIKEFDNISNWDCNRLQRRKIFRDDEKKNVINMIRVKNMAMEYLLKYAIEPTSNDVFFTNNKPIAIKNLSRTIQRRIIHKLNDHLNQSYQGILDIKVKKISLDNKIKFLTLPKCNKKNLNKIIRWNERNNKNIYSGKNYNEKGLSKVLKNILSKSIETIHIQDKNLISTKQGIKYMNNIIFFLKEAKEGEKIINIIDKFFIANGLKKEDWEFNFIKTMEKFSFVDWNFTMINHKNKYVCYPSKDNRLSLAKRIKTILKDNRYKLENRFNKAKTTFRNWFNYHLINRELKNNSWLLKKWTYTYISKHSNINKNTRIELIRKIFDISVKKTRKTILSNK